MDDTSARAGVGRASGRKSVGDTSADETWRGPLLGDTSVEGGP